MRGLVRVLKWHLGLLFEEESVCVLKGHLGLLFWEELVHVSEWIEAAILGTHICDYLLRFTDYLLRFTGYSPCDGEEEYELALLNLEK